MEDFKAGDGGFLATITCGMEQFVLVGVVVGDTTLSNQQGLESLV